MTRFKCTACCDTRKVVDVFQWLRPCSRCDVEGFIRWQKERVAADQGHALPGQKLGGEAS